MVCPDSVRPLRSNDRHRDPQRQLGGGRAGGGDRGLGVQRVEDRLDQQQVGPAVGQRPDLLFVRGLDLVEGDGAVGGILHPRGQRERDVHRADRAGHEPAARLVGGLAGQLGAAQVHLPHQRLQAVVGLADAGGGEGVGGGDVRARREVVPVRVQDQVRPGQVEQVRVTGHVLRVVAQPLHPVVGRGEPGALEHRAPGPVEDRDALAQQLAQGRGAAFRPGCAHQTPPIVGGALGSPAGPSVAGGCPLQRLSALVRGYPPGLRWFQHPAQQAG